MASDYLMFSALSDYALLCMSRLGFDYARDVLAVRYFEQRKHLCNIAVPVHQRNLEESLLNEAFFRAYLTAEEVFEFGKASFQTLLITILRREILRECRRVAAQLRNFPTISLDQETLPGTYLCDSMPEADSSSDPRAFVNYADMMERLGKLPKCIPAKAIDIAKLLIEGYSLKESCTIVDISLSYGKHMMRIFREWARGVVDVVNPDGTPAENTNAFQIEGLDEELDGDDAP